MSRIAEKIRKEALSLAPDERASLAHDLISSLDNPGTLELTPEYEKEIQRRLDAIRRGRASSRPADAVFADIETRLK